MTATLATMLKKIKAEIHDLSPWIRYCDIDVVARAAAIKALEWLAEGYDTQASELKRLSGQANGSLRANMLADSDRYKKHASHIRAAIEQLEKEMK